MNRINANRKNPLSATTSICGEAHPRRAGLAAAIGSVLGIALPLTVWAGDAGSSITTDGKTDTTVSLTAQDRWKVATTTIKGRQPGNQVAFNSFKEFGIEAGQTVDLILPTKDGSQVHNLVNLVSDSRAYINGTLNGFLADEATVGGRVFFVDPHGLLVSAGGVVNVGSLSVATPTRTVMDDMLAVGESLDGLMFGTLKPEQLSGGEVRIAGRINASNGVRVQARAIDVTGTILVAVTPAAGRDANSSLQRVDETAVNTGGAGAPLTLVDDGGKIQLRAAAISDTGLGERSAAATVTVGGNAKLEADDIELRAIAMVDSGYDKDAATFDELKADLLGSVKDMSTLTDLGDALVNLGVDKVLGEQVSFLHASTTARVEVKDNATLDARNDIALHASTRQAIDNSAAGKAYEKGDYVTDANGDPVKDASGNPVPKKHLLSLGAAYGQINATSEAIIRSGASVTAGGDVSVKADADTAMKLAAESFAVNNTTAAFTAAISNVNVNTSAVIEAGKPLTAGSVNVSAVNTSSIETSATARADNQGAVGLAGAVSLQDIKAEARLDRDVTTHATGGHSGDVTVQAASITSLNKTESLIAGPKSEPLPGQEQVEAISSGSDGLMGMAQSLAGSGIGKALEKINGDDAGGNTGGGTTPTTPPKAARFRLGGAISFVDGEHAAKASIGNNATINSAGDIVVDSQVVDAQIGNHAISNVLAKGKSGDGSAFALSGAITIANLEHDAQTLVGSGAKLSADHIGLASDVRLPRDFSALTGAVPNFDSFDKFKDSLGKAKDLITDPSDLFTSYSAAKGSAEKVAIGGAVSYFKAKNSARTDVASGASLTTTDASGKPWSVALDGDDHAGKARARSFDAATEISATTDVTALHAAGDLALKNLISSNVDKGGTALGGSVGYMDYDNTAAAIVNDGVTINAGAGSIAVDALNKETIVSLALQSGQGGSIGVSGTASALDLDSRTLAGVSNRATLTADTIGISAEEDMFVWSVAGAVAMSDSISVGASVAYQQMDTDTHAFIGAIPADFKTGTSGATGQVNTGDLSVNAASEGLSGAVAAAGAIAKSSSEQLKQQQDALAKKQNAENPGFLDGLKKRAMGKVTALEGMAKKADSEGSAGLTQYFDKAKGLLGSGSGQGGQGAQTPQPKFGVALSGSATVNRARQNTKADISNAVVKDNSGNGVKLDIAAINKTLLVSISGALSVTAAGSDNNQGSASLAGGVAYGDIQNSTTAGLLNSRVQDAGDVTVTARNESEQVNVGISVGVNASSDQTTAAAGAISATVAMSKNETAANLRGSTIQGKAGASADVDVKAVNESKIANGGGALYAGGKAGLGAAVTYAEIKDDTRAGISGGVISGVNDVRVRAADASRIIAAAASGGASTQNNGVAVAGSVLVNQVANTTIASINDGASISFAGDLEAFAGTASISDVRSTTGGCESGAGMDYCGAAIGGIQVDANADTSSKEDTTVDAAGRNAGKSSIIAVAGMVQVGGNNAGVAFAYNTIKNTHAVSVNGATLNATSGGDIALTAADKADILAVSAGIGGSTGNFTGVGSASYNAIGNTTAVLVGSSVPGVGAASKAGATLNAGNITLDASDEAFIGSFAGAATLGSKVAVGAALTINDIGNNTQALVDGANLDVDSGDVTLQAANKAKILSGAVAAGAANNVAIQGSVGWSTIANTAEAALKGGTLEAGGLGVHASNRSKVYTLAGAVAGSGNAAIGAAINVATIGDTTRATVDETALAVSDTLDVTAAADATTKTLAIAGALAGTASIAGSNTSNFIDSTTEASIHDVTAQGAGVTGDVTVNADTKGKTYSLGGALAVGGSAGVGAASSGNSIGGSTSAVVDGAALNNASSLAIEAANRSLIRTAAVSGAGAGAAAVAGSVTTNLISSTTGASLVDSVVNNDAADVVVRARDERNIDSLAGSAAVAGSVGVGAAVAYNDIGGSTSAVVKGNALDLDVRNLLVSADASGAAGGNGNRIRTIAAGLGGGGAVGGAASVAVNRMQGTVSARIEGGADVVAQNNVGVLAAQAQSIDVFAGSVGGGAAAGIGLGTVVNLVDGTTEAGIYGSNTEVTALGHGDALKGINSGVRTTANTHSSRTDTAGMSFDKIDLRTGSIDVHGVAVDAATRQQVSTLGFSGALGTTPIASGAVAVMAAVNQIAGSTVATIKDAKINQHGVSASGDLESTSDSLANNAQGVDVRASHHVASASYVAGIAGSPGVFSGAGALSTNLFDSNSTASIDGATVSAADDVTVAANASQNALAIVVGAAAGLVGGAATGVVNDFNTNTRASVLGGSVRSGSLEVTADSDNAASLVGGAGSAGLGAAVAGTALVNLGRSSTQARVGQAGKATDVSVSRTLEVAARSRSDFNGVAISGALAGGAGVAGMAQVHLLENDTQAVIQNATVSATDTSVVADEILRLSSFSGALGVGVTGSGVGAGASVAILGSSVRANVLDSDIKASGEVAVNAASDRAVDMVTMTGGAGLSTGIGGAASLLLAGVGDTGDSGSELGGTFGSLKRLGGGEKVNSAALQGTLGTQGASALNARGSVDLGSLQGRGDLVQAKVSGGSLEARELGITADSRMRSSNTVGGVGLGGLGIGGAFGMTGLYGTTEATLAAAKTRASSIDVIARAGDGAGGKAAELDVYAGAAGLVGVGAAVGIANLEQTVTASVQGDVAVTGQAKALDVRAADDSQLDVFATGMAVGAAAVGAVVAKAERDANVAAWLANDSIVNGFSDVIIDAASAGAAHAKAIGAAGGVLAGVSAAVALADDSSKANAWVGDRSKVSGVNGDVSVTASARPDVSAEAVGAAVAVGLAVGAAVADATSHTTVGAWVGKNSVLANRGDLNVSAAVNAGKVEASAFAGSGGMYLAGAGAFATASSSNAVDAEIRDGVMVHGEATAQGGTNGYGRAGDVSVKATNNSHQNAHATGISVAGLLAAGVVKAKATSDSTTDLRIGDSTMLFAGDVVLGASGTDENTAKAKAGSGGLLAGNAALASTQSRSGTLLLIGENAVMDVSRLEARAAHDARYGGSADSTSAGVLNASGADVSNVAASDVHIQIGQDARLISAGSTTLRTDNNYNSTLGSALAVSAAGGGVLTGSAAGVTTELTGSSMIDVDRGALLRTGHQPGEGDTGVLDVVAGTRANTDDRAGLTTGGAINVAIVKASTQASLRNKVNIANDAKLQSSYMLNVGTYANTDIGANALVNTWGVLAAVGKSDADVTLDMDQQVNVESGAKLESLHNAFVSAGQDGMNGWTSRLSANAVALGYSRGLIAIPDSSAHSTLNSDASTRLAAGSSLLSGAFVSLGSYGENVFRNADGAATGYNLGFIPVTVRDSQALGRTTGDVIVDGTVVAGRYNVLDIVIDADGTLNKSGAGGDVLEFESSLWNSNELKAVLNADGIHSFDETANKAAKTWSIGDLYAAGGDIILFGNNIRGTGSMTAKGAPRITIVNNSNHNLLLAGDILVPDYSGGNILFTGNSDQAHGIGLSQNPGLGNAQVSISNLGSLGSAIGAGGRISVTGGQLSIYNAQGSIYGWGEQLAENVTINAPNGEVGYNLGTGSWYGNIASSLWRQHSLAYGITNADDAAGFIANAVYGKAAAQAGMSLTDYLLYKGYDTSKSSGGGSIFVYGACNYRVGDKDCTESSLKGQFYDGGQVSKYSHDSTNFVPRVNARTLLKELSSQPNDVTSTAQNGSGNTGPGINAGTGIKITANYIDVNVALKAGKPVDYSAIVSNSPGLRAWIDAKDAQGTKGIFDVPVEYVSRTSGDSQKVSLKYDSLNRQFIVPDIWANGGGSITLDGKIVSTSTSGSLNVISGKGSVVIDNKLADVGLQLGNILVGNGAPGQITIRDRLRNVSTWYQRDANGNVSARVGAVDASGWSSPGLTPLAATGAYNPLTGMRGRWTQTANIRRNINWADNGAMSAENWRWVDANGKTLYDGQQWAVSGMEYYNGSGNGNLFDSKVSGQFYNQASTGVNYRCEKGNSQGCRYNYGFPGENQFKDGETWRTFWGLKAPTSGRLTVTNTVKADNAIAINFKSNDAGVLDIDSGQTIRINGVLKNTDGSTSLTSVYGSIESVSNDARIITNKLTLEAGRSIGTLVGAQPGDAANPIDIQMVSYKGVNGGTVEAGSITVRAGGDVALDVDSAAKVLISAGNGTATGNVWLRAKYDIEGVNTGTASITGGDITLYSTYGGIGSMSRPLLLRANEFPRSDGAMQGGLVTAKATGDIALSDLAGDFWVRHIESTAGDVLVDAASGSIFSASQRGAASFLSEAELNSLRENLKLYQGAGEQSVVSYQSQVDASYAEYFQLRGLGSVSGGQFVAGSNAINLYRSMAEAAKETSLDDAGVAAYLAERYARLTVVFADAFGAAWEQETVFASGFDASFRYELAGNTGDSAQAAARKGQLFSSLTDESKWTKDQLQYVFNANALEPSTGSALNAEPVIVGRNITLRAKDNLGRLANEYTVSLADVNRGAISDDAALAMRLATTPGDVEMLDASGNVLTAQQVRDGYVVASLRIKSTAPVVVDAKGTVDAIVGADTYLHGSSTLTFSRFSSGGNARIGSDGDILGVSGTSAASIVVGKDLSLSALRSIMGGDGKPLRVQVNGTLLLADAGEHVKLAQQSGNLRIGIVNANQDVVLNVADGSLLSYLKDVAAVTGRNIQLTVRDDIQDETGAMLAVRIITGGQLNGEAKGDIGLSSKTDMPIGTLTAGGDLQLATTAGALSAQVLDAGAGLKVTGYAGVDIEQAAAGQDATISAPMGDVAVGSLTARSADLNAGKQLTLGDADIQQILRILALQSAALSAGAVVHSGSEVHIDAAGFSMGAGSQLSAGKVVSVRTAGDMSLGQVAISGNAVGSTITLTADGHIQSNGDAAVNIGGGSNVLATLAAGEGIGARGQALTVDVGNLVAARATRGDVVLALPNGGNVGRIEAAAGDVLLTAGDHVQITTIGADGTVDLNAAAATVGAIVAGGNLDARTTGDLDVADAQVTGNVHLTSDGNLHLGVGTVGGSATLSSVGGSTIDSLAVQGTLDVTSGAALAARVLSSGASMTLSSGDTLDVQQLTSGADLTADAAGTLSITDAKVTGAASIDGQADVVLGQTVVGQTLAVNAANDLTATTLDVVGNSTLSSGRNTLVTNFDGRGDLLATAGSNLVITDANVTGNAQLISGGDLDLGTGTVGGNATLSSVGSTTVDSLAVQGALDVTSGAALAARVLSSGASMTLSSGDTLDVQQLTSGGDLTADAISTLSIADANVSGDASIDGKADVVLGQAIVGKTLAVNAATDLTATTLDVAGNSSLSSGSNTSVTSFNGEGDLSAKAGGDLVLDNGTVGGNATLSSVGSTTVDSLAVQGTLDATSGAALAARVLSSGASMTLSSGDTLDVQQLSSGADLNAGAVSTLSIADAKVSGDASIDGKADVVLGQAIVGKTLAVNAGTNLTATTLDVAGNSTLSSGGNTSVAGFNGQGDLLATAGSNLVITDANVTGNAQLISGGDLDLGTGTVGGNATLSSVGSTTVDSLAVQGTLDATSGAALTARSLSTGASMTLSSSNTLDVQQLTSGADLDAEAAGTLSIADATVTGNASIDGKSDVVLGQATVGKTLTVNAANDLAAATLDVVGNSTLSSGRNTSVTSFNGQGDLSAKVGGDLVLGNGTVGGNATLSSIGSTTVDSLAVQGTLDATSGAALTARVLSSGSTMTLTSDDTLDVQQLTSGADLTADAAGTLSIADAKVTGAASIDGQADVVLGQTVVGQTLAVNAANDLTATTLDVVGNSALSSGRNTLVTNFDGRGDLLATAGSNLVITDANVTGNAQLISGGDLDLGTGTVGGNATLSSIGSTTVDSLAVQGTLDATSGAALAARVLSSGSTMTLTSGDTLDVHQLSSGADLDAEAAGTLSIADATVTGNASIDGKSDVALGQAVVGKTLAVNAVNDLTATTLTVAGNSALSSGRNTSVTTFNGQGDLSANAGGDLALDNGTVGGNATLSSVGSTTVDSLAVQGTLDVTSGVALAARVLSSGAAMTLASGSTLDVKQLTSGGDLDADAISTLSIADAKVSGDASIDGKADVVLGQATLGKTLTVNATTNLTATTLDVAGNSTLSSGGNTSVTSFNGQGDLSAKAGGDLVLDNGTVGGNATLSSVGSTTVDSLAVQGTLEATSGAALAARVLSSGASMTLSSGDTLDVQQLSSGADLNADAVSTLSIADAKVSGDASIDGKADVVLGQATVGKTLAVNATNDLTATTLDVAGNSTLSSGGNTSVTSFNGQGDLSAKAGGDLALDNGAVGGSATLSSVGRTTIGTLSTQGTLDATSGAALTARSLSTGASMTLSSSNTLDVHQLSSGADLDAEAAGTLSIADATVTGNASIDGKSDVALGQAVVGKTLAVNAVNDLTATTLTVAGNSALSSGRNTSVTTFNGQGDLSANAGGDLALDNGTVGGNATLSSVGSTTVDSLAVQGTLDASSGAAMTARVLSSGSVMTLTSGDTLDVHQLSSGADLNVGTVSTLSIADAKVSGDASIDGKADVVLGQATVGKALTVNAANDLTASQLTVTGNSTLDSGADMSVTTFGGKGDLAATAAGNAAFDTVNVGGSMILQAGKAINVGTAVIGVDGTWVAGTDLTADDVTTGCNFSGDAGGTLAIGSVQTGCGLQLASTDSLSFGSLHAGADIGLTSRGGDVLGRSVDAGGSLRVDAADGIAITAASAGADITANSGGTQQWGSYEAGRDAQLTAGSDVRVGSGVSGGLQSIISGGSIQFDRIQAGTTVSMDAQGGALTGGQLRAASGALSARDHLSLADAMVDTRLNLAADDINAHIAQSNEGQGPLTTTLTGYRNGVARKVVVEVDPRDAWLIDQIKAVDAQLASSAARVDIAQGFIEKTMTLKTAGMNVLMDNTSPVLRPVDVQLTQLDKTFRLSATDTFLDTNAYVVRFADGFRVTSPNYNPDHVDGGPNYLGESAVRYMGRMLKLDTTDRGSVPASRWLDDEQQKDDVISSAAGAVNLGAPN
ncbi:MAG: leukotoxin LktA family filamentous adhesin [Stenotrophomonas sp.]|uniref:leukotoxin LktA family filamentous adhesin n=1 Tax=Stenotrophomonas sp. TaxID=69392 RepID=UPI003D6C94D7